MNFAASRRFGVLALGLLLVVPQARAQEWIGDRDAMVGEISVDDGKWQLYPAQLPFGDAQVEAKITFRYRLWGLVGEPVLVWEPRYEVRKVFASRFLIERDEDLPTGTVSGGALGSYGASVRAAPDVMAGIRLWDLHLVARVVWGAAALDSHVFWNRPVSAVFAAPGEWGWDVPGSPSWKRLFTYNGEASEDPGFWLTQEQAQSCWKRLEAAWKTRHITPIERVTVSRVRWSFSRFWARAERAQPGVTRAFFERQRPGAPPADRAEEAEGLSVIERAANAWVERKAKDRAATEFQIQSLLNGLTRELERAEAESGRRALGAPSRAFARRLAITERALTLLPEPEPHFSAELGRLRAWGNSLAIDAELQDLARVAGEKDGGGREALEAAGDRLRRLRERAAAAGPDLLPATRRRLDRLRWLDAGHRGEVVAEWTGPRPPLDSQGAHRPRHIRPAGLYELADGRVVVVFVHYVPDHVDAQWSRGGATFVDGQTGQVLKEVWTAHVGMHPRKVRRVGPTVLVLRTGAWSREIYACVDLRTMSERPGPWAHHAQSAELLCSGPERFVTLSTKGSHSRIGVVEAWEAGTGRRMWSSDQHPYHDGYRFSHSRAHFDASGRWIVCTNRELGSGGRRFEGVLLDADTGSRRAACEGGEAEVLAELARAVDADLSEFIPAPSPDGGAPAPPPGGVRSDDGRWLLVPHPPARPDALNDEGGVRYRLLR